MLPERIKEDIEFEISEIDHLFQLYKDELFYIPDAPNKVELIAIAGILHSFYNGIEKILLIIAKKIDKNVPFDLNWHKTLLVQIAAKNTNRDAVFSEEIMNELLKYLGFRHFFRHSYSFHLKWERIEDLISPLGDFWPKLKAEILSFCERTSILPAIPSDQIQ